MAKLFDEMTRSDDAPAWPAEDSFAFLNRAAGPVWERQRELLDEWYQDFPDENGDLRRRFREADARQHYAAWWELYVHALLRALGFAVLVHPKVPGADGRPDFLAERPDAAFYVEAATVFSGIVSPTRQSRALVDILDTIARLDSSTFWVSLRVDRVGTSMPPKRTIRRAIDTWTAGLDPDVIASVDLTDERAWKPFEFRDWVISLRPAVWQPRFRGCPKNRFVGMRTGIAGFVDDIPKLRNAITRKGKRYGTPDKPLVVAVLPQTVSLLIARSRRPSLGVSQCRSKLRAVLPEASETPTGSGSASEAPLGGASLECCSGPESSRRPSRAVCPPSGTTLTRPTNSGSIFPFDAFMSWTRPFRFAMPRWRR